MKLTKAAVLFCFVSTTALATTNADAVPSSYPSNAFVLKAGDKITGSISAIQAFQAIRDKNVIALVKVINESPTCVNETLTFVVNNSSIKLRLVHIAVLMKEPYVIGVLKLGGARITAKDSLGKTAAHYASFGAPNFGSQFSFKPFVDGEIAASMLELLHSEAIDLESTDKDSRTPLHYAALAGDPSVINRLISLGVSLDPVDAFGCTPKQLAVQGGFFRAIPALLSKAGAASPTHYWDYVLGAKTTALFFGTAHPFVTFGTVAGSVGLYLRRFFAAAPKAKISPRAGPILKRAANNSPRTAARSRSGAGSPAAGSPRGGATRPAPTTGLPIPVLRSSSPASIVADGSDSSLLISAIATSTAIAAATAAAAASSTVAATDPKVQEIVLLTAALNKARKQGDDAIAKALTEAEEWLKQGRDPQAQELEDEIQKERVYLIAAIKTVSTFKETTKVIRDEAHRLLLAYVPKAPEL